MTVKNFTTETNYCDFCGKVCERSSLYMIVAGLTKEDYREVVCEECRVGMPASEGYSSFGLDILVAS